MKHGHRMVLVALVAAVLALALVFAVNSGLATMAVERETPPTGHRQFDMPADGDLCVRLENNRCGAKESEGRSIP